jgi:histidinol-phosphate aminotransferase
VIQTILLAYGGHGRTVATFEPTYQMYAQIARVTGAEVVEGERRADLTLDPIEIERVVARHQPAVTFLCNPNNPTGLVEPRENLEALLEVASGIVVVDEAYAEFSDWSAMELVSENKPIAVTRTFSKTLSMAALRVGYVVGPTWLINNLRVAALPYHLDAFKQAATIAALQYTEEMEERVEFIKAQRARLESEMRSLGLEVWTSGSNFVLFRSATHDAKSLWSAVLARGVLVRDCSSWPRLEGCLRVTVGTESENTAFLAALQASLSA